MKKRVALIMGRLIIRQCFCHPQCHPQPSESGGRLVSLPRRRRGTQCLVYRPRWTIFQLLSTSDRDQAAGSELSYMRYSVIHWPLCKTWQLDRVVSLNADFYSLHHKYLTSLFILENVQFTNFNYRPSPNNELGMEPDWKRGGAIVSCKFLKN